MRDTLDGVDLFVEAVEAGSFARAGQRLALSRSAVGKAIARLEARLGVRLFHRTTRAQTLTEEGEAYYARCRRALDELRAGEQAMDAGRADVAGRLRIAMPTLFGRRRVVPVLLDLVRRYPKLELDLRFGDTIVDIVGEGFDLAIRNGPLAQVAGLRARRLFGHCKVMCAAPAYVAEYGAPESLADLAEHEALVYWRHGGILPWTMREPGGTAREPELNWRLRFDDLEAIVDAAVAGLGIAFLPDWLVVGCLAEGSLMRLLEDHTSAAVDTFAVWPEAHQLPRRTRAAIDALATSLGSGSP